MMQIDGDLKEDLVSLYGHIKETTGNHISGEVKDKPQNCKVDGHMVKPTGEKTIVRLDDTKWIFVTAVPTKIKYESVPLTYGKDDNG